MLSVSSPSTSDARMLPSPVLELEPAGHPLDRIDPSPLRAATSVVWRNGDDQLRRGGAMEPKPLKVSAFGRLTSR